MDIIENENFVPETENVEVPTEEAPKIYTQADFDRMVKEKVDEILPGKISRREAKIRKEYDREYGALTNVLKAGTGKESVPEITDALEKFYAGKGVPMPQQTSYSAKDLKVLADAEAAEIIRGGYEDVVEETDRLAKIGPAKMTEREKAVFAALAAHRKEAERKQELASLGIGEDVYSSKEFTDFAARFRSDIPMKEIYEDFVARQPKKNIKPMGSMKQGQDNGPKEHYTMEEISRLTEEELMDPVTWANVRRAMTGQ